MSSLDEGQSFGKTSQDPCLMLPSSRRELHPEPACLHESMLYGWIPPTPHLGRCAAVGSTVHLLLQEMALCAETEDNYWSLLMQLYTLACAYIVITMVVCVWRTN